MNAVNNQTAQTILLTPACTMGLDIKQEDRLPSWLDKRNCTKYSRVLQKECFSVCCHVSFCN